MRPNQKVKKYHLSYKDVVDVANEVKYMDDIEIRLSGGEPFLWEGDIKRLIEELFDLGFTVSIITNGSFLKNSKNIKYIFGEIVQRKLKLYISIDIWHKNYNVKDCRNKTLDNLIEWNNTENNLDIYVQTTYTTDKQYNMSTEFIKYYRNKGIKFTINSLLPWGNGKNMDSLIPKLSLSGNSKAGLGEYWKVLYSMGVNNNYWKEVEEFKNMQNIDIFLNFDYCGKNIYVKKDGVYYCEFFGDQNKICNLSEFNQKKFEEKIDENKWIKKIKNLNLASLKEYNAELPFDYGKCSICKFLKMILKN